MVQKLYITIRDFSRQLGKQNISAHAASTAFFFFLSIVPMLVLLSAIIPYMPLTQDDLANAVMKIMPEQAAPLIKGLITEVYQKSAGVVSIAIIATIWSSAKGILALMRGLNAINQVEDERHYFLARAAASLYTLAMLFVVLISLVIMVFGRYLMDLIIDRVSPVHIVWTFLMKFHFLLVWLILTFLFSAIYAYIPNKKLRLMRQLPGGVFTAVAWSIFSWGFSVYVRSSQPYSVYGSLSIIVMIMIWMYFCMYILMVGAYLNLYVCNGST